MGAYPHGVDWNNDGKQDLIAGDSSGNVWLFLNRGTGSQVKLAEGVRVRAGGKDIVGVAARYERNKDGQYERVPNKVDIMGVYSKLHMADWDGDGLKDLLIGQDGPDDQQFVFYRNQGEPNQPVFAEPVAFTMPPPGMSRPSPYLVDWDDDGKVDMLCGTERSAVYFFRNIGEGKGQPKYAEGVALKLEGEGFNDGYRCRIHVTDWNNDGKKDLLVGNFISVNRRSGGNVWLFLGQ